MKKMTFTAYLDNGFDEKNKLEGVDPYMVMINPETFSRRMGINYEKTKKKDYAGGSFKGTQTATYTFEFIVDGTGVANNGVKEDVKQEINNFKKVVYDHIPKTHRPPFVEIAYCDEIFKCVLDSLDITYNLFHPDGQPLRAKISCSFSDVINPLYKAKVENNNSPDMTHKRIPLEGENLVSMANRIYECNDYYIDVGEKNGLNNFRQITPGDPVYFPPLKDE